MNPSIPCITMLILCTVVCASSKAVAEHSQQGTLSGTATNLKGIDLNDTTEDPAYAEAGEALVKDAAESVIGKAAPVAKMTPIDGKTIDLSKIYGKKPVYLKFWATWCTPCRQQMPGFERAYQLMGDEMEVIAVNIGYSDDEDSVRAFRDLYGLTMPIVIDDGRLAKLFHVNVTPQHVLIGKDIRFAYIGHAENHALEDALQHAVTANMGTNSAKAVKVKPEHMIKPGAKVPDLHVSCLGEETIPLKAQPGRLIAVQFFSTWGEWYLESTRPETSAACARVRKEIEAIASSNHKVDWLGIAGGLWTTEQDLKDYKNNYKVSIPLSLDKTNDLFRLFNISDIPTIALINSEGTLIRLIAPNETGLADIIQTIFTESIDK